MPLGSQFSSLMLLLSTLDTSKPTVYKPKKEKVDKPVMFHRDDKINFLPRCLPSEVGIKDEYITSFFNEMSLDYSTRINRMIIAKDGYVIGEKYYYPYTKDSWDCVYSATKSVISLGLGALLKEHNISVDTPAFKVLGIEKQVGNANCKKITIRHLLTHSTGNTFNEMESVSTINWVKDYFASGQKFKIGSKFEYNSMNTYILSAIISKLSGKKTYDYLKENIFDPLEMSETYMETSFEGITKGGWGLYILPEDMVKLGLMIISKGVYKGKRIIDEDWINEITKKQYPSSKQGHRFDYGYQFWVSEEDNMHLMNGLYDQDILMFPNTGIVIVVNGANPDAFHSSKMYDVAFKYFSKGIDGSLPIVKISNDREIKNIDALDHYYRDIQNKKYYLIDKIATSTSLLPVLLQNSFSTYGKGIKEVSFRYIDDKYYLYIKEDNKDYNIEFNFSRGVRQTLSFYKNIYDVHVDARFYLNEKSYPFLMIRLFFLEFASTRYITIKFDKRADVLSMELSESPGLDFANSLMEIQDASTKALVNNAIKLMNPDLFKSTIKKLFSPRFRIVEENEYLKLEKKK